MSFKSALIGSIFPPAGVYSSYKELAGKQIPKLPAMPSKKAAAGVGGIVAEGGLLGGGRVDYAPTITTVEAEPYQYYAPQIQYAPVTGYQYQAGTYIIDSPGAVAKKEQAMKQVSKPEMRGEWAFPVDIEQVGAAPVTGTNLTAIAIVAVIGAAGIMLIKSKKG